ncbi:MAG: NHLP bacteriocin export ABC transporter permease/ATPase subunit [Oscillospiraceae bacterium]|nr:NHLP bacteriocin export ABC transporter permease/ATPase subunit [Oscillospiraceae bacterium]
MDTTAIKLRGNHLLLTEKTGEAYRVLSGRVLVFILPLEKDGSPGRRWLLCELTSGDTVPALFYDSTDIKGNPCRWAFGLSALDPSELEVVNDSKEIRDRFSEKAGLRDYDQIGFEESAVESCRLEHMRDQRNLFASGEERKMAYSRSLEIIYRLFRNSKAERRQIHENTGHALYDACVRLCDWQGIEPVSLDVLRANCGRRFTAKDMARVSGFICRDILLEENWFRSDAGPFLGFVDKGKPVVCLPQKAGRYLLWDPANDSITPVTQKVAAQLDPKALVFYRPFPREEITLKKLMLFALQDMNWRDVANILLFTLLGTLVGLLTPYLNEQLFDLFVPLGDAPGLQGVCAVILACSLGNISFTIVKNLANFRALNRMKYSVQAAVLDRLFNLPESFFRSYDSADLGQRAMGISQVFSMLASTVVSVGLTAVFSLMYLWRMFRYTRKLSWMSIWMLLTAMVVILLLGRKEMKHEREQMELDGQAASMMFQFLNGISKLRIAGAENQALYEYLRGYTESRKLDIRKEKYNLMVTILSGTVSTLFSMVFYYIMVHQSIEMSVGAFMGFTTAFSSFSAAMMNLVSAYLQVNAIGPAFDRMKPILNTLPEQQENAGMPGDLTGEIEISNVTFAYDEDSPPVIRDLSFHIKAGEYIGIVGSSGCGKSTLLKLLLGFEKPQTGRIYYDRRDIDGIDKRELRKRLGVVLQNGGLITGSIYDNITITSSSATMEQVKQAVRDAGLEKDIADMPMGLHTVLSEGDGSISGGQKQRILIARAIVNKPKLLFFDEATSALDNATQAMVCESLDQLKATRIVIAHRLSTIIHCDRIFVMDGGQIVEEGNFEQLMERKGLFYELASRQIF